MTNQLYHDLKLEIKKKFISVFSQDDYKKNLNCQNKKDQSIVTDIDFFISQLVKDKIGNLFKDQRLNFFSEEEQGNLKWPSVILDPIDGTKELVLAIPECSVSLAIMYDPKIDHKDNLGWIFNPFNGFEITSNKDFYGPFKNATGKLLGFVSRTEWSDGLYQDIDLNNVILCPKGSIAYKLGLLAAGACDFVVTRRPKKIWDMASGTIICKTRGVNLYQNGVELDSLKEVLFDHDLFWCRPEIYEEVSSFFPDKSHK